MTETNANSKSLYAATGPQILAHLLLLQQRHALPDWTGLEVRSGRKTVDLRFTAPADVEAWAVGMGRDPKHINRSDRSDGTTHAWIVVQLGVWNIDCEGITAPSSKLDAETVAGLEAVAVGHLGDHLGNDCEPAQVSA